MTPKTDRYFRAKDLQGLVFLGFHVVFPFKIKSAATEATARKTQAPIVAKQIIRQNILQILKSWNLRFYQIHICQYDLCFCRTLRTVEDASPYRVKLKFV